MFSVTIGNEEIATEQKTEVQLSTLKKYDLNINNKHDTAAIVDINIESTQQKITVFVQSKSSITINRTFESGPISVVFKPEYRFLKRFFKSYYGRASSNVDMEYLTTINFNVIQEPNNIR